MANFLPDAFREELQRLQDQVPPRPYRDIEARLREEFGGRAPTEVFAEFSPEPVASASIGQVHVARLPTGERVAVKVQYPDIEEIVRTDLRALEAHLRPSCAGSCPTTASTPSTARSARWCWPSSTTGSRRRAIQRITANFVGRPNVRFPRVMAEFSTARVLTTEWMEGAKVADLERPRGAQGSTGARPRAICVEAYCQQIFIDGLYHADPHPGKPAAAAAATRDAMPTIVFLDFGATARSPRPCAAGWCRSCRGR